MASAGLFKGWATWGFQGFVAPVASAPASISQGLVLPTPLTTYAALGSDLDGRKIALLDGSGGWLILPDVCDNAGEFYTCYNSDGTQRWQKAATDINASATRWWPNFFYDTIDAQLYVLAGSTSFRDTTSGGVEYHGRIDITTGVVSAVGNITSVTMPCFATASSPTPRFTTASLTAAMAKAARSCSHSFRDGMATGDFETAVFGTANSPTNVSATGFSFISWFGTTSAAARKSGSLFLPLVGYQTANADLWIDYFNYSGTLRIARGGVFGAIGWNNIPGGGPTFAGGLTGETVTPQHAQGITPVNWGQNQVVLVGFTTELIFGERYYARDEFDAWLHRVADFIGLPA